jgi:hypothetical protein
MLGILLCYVWQEGSTSVKYGLAAASGGWVASKPTFQGHSDPQDVGLLTIQPRGVTASLGVFYGI